MSVTSQCQKTPLAPIFKHSSRKWKELSSEGTSVGINDPKLKAGYLGNLGKKTKIELEELISRQDKLLSNAEFLAKLKDGGQRLQGRREELQQTLDRLEESSRDHSALPSIPDMTALEWQWRSGSPSMCEQKEEADPLDSDDDEDPNPLHLLATHSMDAPPRIPGASGSRSLKGMQDDIDPSESIREELRKLDIRDQITEENMLNSANGKICSKANQLDSDLAQDFGSKVLISLEQKSKLKLSEEREVFKPFRLKNKQRLLAQTTIKFSSTSDEQTPYHSISHSNITTTTTTTTTSGAAANPSFGVSATPIFPSLNPINVTGSKARRSALWACESAATGPLAAGAGRSVQLIPLRESVELERRANERLRELQLQRTTGSSSAACGGPTTNKKSSLFAYRDKNAMDTFLNNGDSDDELVEDLLASKMIDRDDDSVYESSEEEED